MRKLISSGLAVGLLYTYGALTDERMSLLAVGAVVIGAVFLGELVWNIVCAPHRMAITAGKELSSYKEKDEAFKKIKSEVEPLRELYDQGGDLVMSLGNNRINEPWSNALATWRNEVESALSAFPYEKYGFVSLETENRMQAVIKGADPHALVIERAILVAQLGKLRLIIMREDDRLRPPKL